MADTFVECLVARETPKSASMFKIGFIVLGCAFFSLGVFSPLFWILLVVDIIVAVIVTPGFNVEYEYVFLADQMNVDKIINMAKRKKLAEYEMSRVDIIAPVDSREIQGFSQNPNNKSNIVDYTSQKEGNPVYGMIYNGAKGKTLVYFEPNQKLINALYAQNSRKVIKGEAISEN